MPTQAGSWTRARWIAAPAVLGVMVLVGAWLLPTGDLYDRRALLNGPSGIAFTALRE